MRLRLPHVALVGVLAIGLTGGAVAAIPSATGKISGCYATADGKLRIVDAESPAGRTCLPGEQSLAFTQPTIHEVVHQAAYSGAKKSLVHFKLPPNSTYTITASAVASRPWSPIRFESLTTSCAMYLTHPGDGWHKLDEVSHTFPEKSGEGGWLKMRTHLSGGPTGAEVHISCAGDYGGYDDYASVSNVRLEAEALASYTREEM